MKNFTSFSSIIVNFTRLIKQQNEKNFQGPISRVKFPVESKSGLRIEVQNKRFFFQVFDRCVKNAVHTAIIFS